MPDRNPYHRKSRLLSNPPMANGASNVIPFPTQKARQNRGKAKKGAPTTIGGKPAVHVELLVASNFSFLAGASHPEEIAFAAARLDLKGFSICDRNTLAGIVRGHIAAREAGIAYAPGCRLGFVDGTPDIAVWPRDRAAYGRLCRLLTTGNLRARKGECHLTLDDLLQWREGLEMAVLPGPALTDLADPVLKQTLAALGASGLPSSDGLIHLGLICRFDGHDRRRFAELRELANRTGVPLIALGDIFAHSADRLPMQHVLTCIREHVALDEAGYRLAANAERHLKPPAEIGRLYRGYEDAVAHAARLFDRLTFSLDELRYEYPEESAGQSATPQAELERLAWLGAAERYSPRTHPGGIPEKVKKAIEYELQLVAELDYAPYFLTVWDIVRFARSRDILCQGRGSAANSTICFCLGITEVDPDRVDLLFERFISAERREPPDIDVDFEHARREEVIQYVYDKYGRDRAGIAATIITYRARSAAREVGKAFGLSEDTVSALSANVWGWSSSGLADDDARRAGLDPKDARVNKVLALTKEIAGFPRHLSQHVGGFVITRGRLDEVVPVMNGAMEDRTHIEWDKDDLDALGMLKIDILALGMLTAMKKTLDLLETHYGRQLTLASIPPEDPQVYDMICRADTLGVFQIESRAQMTMLPRLRPHCFYDLVIEVAIVRPGPIQGDMVHPFLRRRQGHEKVVYPAPAPAHGPADELEQVLGRTLGVPLFQEQAMKIAIVAAGFAPAEADRLRRAMATFRRVGTIHTFQEKMVRGMTARGYDADFADRCFRQIEGFGEYGFPESHAASFALLVYSSCWMKCHYPDVFLAAMLNAQPLGFYAPAQLVRDAREHGVEVRPVDINHSSWDATLEPETPAPERRPVHARHRAQEKSIRTACAVRLGLRQIKGLKEADADLLVAARRHPYHDIRDLWLRSGLARSTLERLAEADAFRSIGLDRREALWRVRALDEAAAAERPPLFGDDPDLFSGEPSVALPAMAKGEHVVNDYRTLALSLKAHPVSFVRAELACRRIIECTRLTDLSSGRRVTIAGLVLVRQRPGTAKGVIFQTLEDETGIANVIVWPKTFERYRTIVMGSRFVAVTGKVQSEQGVIHVIADRLEDLTPLLALLSEDSAFSSPGTFAAAGRLPAGPAGVLGNRGLARADEVRTPVIEHRQANKPGSRLIRLLHEAPELHADIRHLARQAGRTGKAMPRGRNFH